MKMRSQTHIEALLKDFIEDPSEDDSEYGQGLNKGWMSALRWVLRHKKEEEDHEDKK